MHQQTAKELDGPAVIRVRKTRAEATAIPTKRPYDGPPTKHILNLGDARRLERLYSSCSV